TAAVEAPLPAITAAPGVRELQQTFEPGSLGRIGQVRFEVTSAFPEGTHLERQIQYEASAGAPAISNSSWAPARSNELFGIPTDAGAATVRFRLIDNRTGQPLTNQT